MLSKQKVKFIQGLQQKKQRQINNIFVVEGEKMVQELLSQSRLKIDALVALEIWADENYKKLSNDFRQKLIVVEPAELRSISTLTTPNKVLATVHMPEFEIDKSALQSNFCLYLDGIQDPGNMGTILRIADWFSISYVFCSDTCVDVYNSKVVQASMGALLRINTREINFLTLKKELPNSPVLAAVLAGESLFEAALPKNGILVLGNEGAGISETVLEATDRKIFIPAGESAVGAESLNVGVAAGILCAFLKK
jgi:RNA methyltransferase, TrmH family